MVCSLKSICVPSFALTGCCVSQLHSHLCPYYIVWPEAVYHCFTRTTLFTDLEAAVALHLLVSEIVILPEAVSCCFTRATLFTTMFTVIIHVCTKFRLNRLLCE